MTNNFIFGSSPNPKPKEKKVEGIWHIMSPSPEIVGGHVPLAPTKLRPCLNYYSRILVLFNFGGDNARVFQRVSVNLSMTVGQATCRLLCRYTQSTLAASCVCWIAPIVTFDSVKRTCGCLCLKCTWSVTSLTGGRGANRNAPLPNEL